MSYDDRFFDSIREGCQRSAAAVVPRVIEAFAPHTVVDVGCGEGLWGKAFEDAGCEVLGLDGHEEPVIPAQRVDLNEALPTFAHDFDLAVCLEVAEHLPPERAESFVEELCGLSHTVLFSAAVPGQGGTGHCFPGNVVVSGPRPSRSFERIYDGPLVDLTFASGEVLSATPNHPVLTTRGWVAAGKLHELDYAIRAVHGQRPGAASLVPDDEQVPALIEDVATALGVSSEVGAASVPVAPKDFHGDGEGSEIAVVRTDCHLGNRLDPALPKQHSKALLAGAGVRSARLAGLGTSTKGLEPPGRSLDAPDQGIGDALARLGASLGGGYPVHLSATPHLDPNSSKTATDSGARGADLVSDLLRRGTGLIQPDQVISVQFREAHEAVYNLSTKPGWYLANGIVVHNCNEQWPQYWAELFMANGYSCSDWLRWEIWFDEDVSWWYRQNLFVASTRHELLHEPPRPVIHPGAWSHFGHA